MPACASERLASTYRLVVHKKLSSFMNLSSSLARLTRPLTTAAAPSVASRSVVSSAQTSKHRSYWSWEMAGKASLKRAEDFVEFLNASPTRE